MNEEQTSATQTSSSSWDHDEIRRKISALQRRSESTRIPGLEDYLKQAGASILYCLSAMFILIGVWKLIGPVMAQSEQIRELLKCVSVLNVYELALLGVLVLVTKWRNVTDDAVSLTVLIGLFLVASGVAIDTIAVTGPIVAAVFGSVCFVLGIAKLAVMRKYVGIRLYGTLFAGLAVLLLWNFLISPIMAAVQEYKTADAELLRQVWQAGWILMLAGFVPVIVHALKGQPEEGQGHNRIGPPCSRARGRRATALH